MKKFRIFCPSLNVWLPCKIGEHKLDFDLVECDIPKDIYAKIIGDRETNLPIGFDITNMPIGFKLERVL